MGRVQKLIKGENSLRYLPSELINVEKKSVFLISGTHFKKQNDLSFLSEFRVDNFIKSGINVNEEEVKVAFSTFLKDPNQAIIAIGGGSVIDLAKAVIYRCIQSALPVPFFIAVPTTSGSGSEATHFAVVYKNKKKYSLVYPSLLPAVVILDPFLTITLPAYQTAVSGIDVLAQAIESFWNKNANTDSKEYAAESISIWKKYYLLSIYNPEIETRSEMQMAAYLAGKAIDITRTTGPHALSYYLTTYHNIPHGQAVALFLPVFFIYNNPGFELCSLLDVADAKEAKEYIQNTMKKAGLACKFAELNLDKESIIEKILDEVNEERFENNPVKFDRDRLKKLFIEYL